MRTLASPLFPGSVDRVIAFDRNSVPHVLSDILPRSNESRILGFESDNTMTANWDREIDDPEERKVFEALADPKWDFRTVDGINKSSRLAREQVVDTINKYEGNLIRRSSIPDAKGRDLFTLRNEGTGAQETWAKLRTFISKSIR